MARKTMTRADMIALLKSRGQKGALSKFTKAKLKKLLDDTAPPGDAPAPSDRPSGDLELEPDEHQSGGHYFGKQGTTRGKGKHTHEKSSWPSQGGSGAAHGYRDFMKKNLKQHGGSMQKAAAAYRAQKGDGAKGDDGDGHDGEKPKQSGGHYATTKGTPAKGDASKYKHSHSSDNPAAGKAAAPAPAPAPAPATPKPTPTPKPKPKPKAAAARPKKTQAKADNSIFDTLEQTSAKAKAAEAAAKAKRKSALAAKAPKSKAAKAAAPPKKAASAKTLSPRQKTKNAKARLRAGGYSNAWLKFKDEAFAAGIFDLSKISSNYKRVNELKKRDEYDAQNAADDREMARGELDEQQQAATAPARAAIKKLGKIPKKGQGGRGLASDSDSDDDEQHGDGFLDDIEGAYHSTKTWVGRAAGKVKKGYDDTEAYVDKHPMLHDLQDGALAIGAVALASTGVGALAELGVGAEAAAATAEAGEVTFGTDTAANIRALDEAGEGGEDAAASEEPQTFRQKLASKLPGTKEVITGLAVGDAQNELRDAEDGPPAPAPAPGPGPTPPPALPPGYFEHMHDAENYMANQQALSGHDGPQPYLNPWYS